MLVESDCLFSSCLSIFSLLISLLRVSGRGRGLNDVCICYRTCMMWHCCIHSEVQQADKVVWLFGKKISFNRFGFRNRFMSHTPCQKIFPLMNGLICECGLSDNRIKIRQSFHIRKLKV